jgi:hypothetical protein
VSFHGRRHLALGIVTLSWLAAGGAHALSDDSISPSATAPSPDSSSVSPENGGPPSGSGGGPTGTGGHPTGPARPAPAAGPTPAPIEAPAPQYGPLEGYFQAKQQLEQATGTIPRLNIDLTSQSAVSGPDDFTSWVWRYDFGINQKLWQGAQADLDVRGGEGPDAANGIGSTENTNQYGNTGSEGFVLHLWVEQKLFDDQLTLRGGKMDMGDFMDVNRFGYYNFLGFSQNHNPAIEFPGNPLAAMFTIAPKPAPIYFSGGIADAAQSSYTIGVPNLTKGPSAPFAMGELGFKPTIAGQPGIYRFIGWYSGLKLTPFDGRPENDNRYGLALSFDQNVTKDFGLFARYGYGDQNEFNPRQFWQAGLDWTGVLPNRPKDDLALAIAQSIFSKQFEAITPDASSSETYFEGYYNAVICDWFQVQPFLQVLGDPGGERRDPAWILSVHLAFRF